MAHGGVVVARCRVQSPVWDNTRRADVGLDVGHVSFKRRLFSPKWFSVLANLAYLRYNYRHFHTHMLPSWCEEDSLLAERFENLAGFMKALSDDTSLERVALQPLFDPFLC